MPYRILFASSRFSLLDGRVGGGDMVPSVKFHGLLQSQRPEEIGLPRGRMDPPSLYLYRELRGPHDKHRGSREHPHGGLVGADHRVMASFYLGWCLRPLAGGPTALDLVSALHTGV